MFKKLVSQRLRHRSRWYKSFTKDDEPVVLVNKTAVRMGSQQNSNSKFYFLLPLEQPKESVAKLCMEVAKELIRAGQENEITGAYSKNGNKEAQQLIFVFVHSLTDI